MTPQKTCPRSTVPCSLRFLFSFKSTAAAVTAITCTLATASSPAAWLVHDRELAAACATASGLKHAQAAGKPMAFDDKVGLTALLVSGRYTQPHIKNRTGRVLCLYDRKTKVASVVEADQLGMHPPPAASR